MDNLLSVLFFINNFSKNKVMINYKFLSGRKSYLTNLIAHNYMSMRRLKWSLKRTLGVMCKDGYQWILKNPNGYYD